jgi:hypothetical protein
VPNKLTISPGEATVKTADVSGQHATRKAAVIGGAVVLSILAVACVVAIFMDVKHERDYVSMILPVISGALLGAGGYVVGRSARKE